MWGSGIRVSGLAWDYSFGFRAEGFGGFKGSGLWLWGFC